MRHATAVLILVLAAPQDHAAELKLCFDEAMNCASIIKDDYHQSDLMREIAEVQARAGLAKEAIETVEAMTYDYFQSLAYTDVALALGKAGRIKEAREILEKGLVSTSEGEQDFKTPHSFGRIAVAFAELGDIDRAVKIATGAKKGVFDEDTLKQIGKLIAAAGDFEKWLKLAEPFKEGRDKSWWVVGIFNSLLEAGQMKSAVDIAQRIPDASLKSGALLDLSKAYCAKGLLDDAARIADLIGDADDRIEALAEIGVLRAKAGKPLEEPRMRAAEGLLKDLTRARTKMDARLQLARWKAAAGDSEGALTLVAAAREEADKIEEWGDWDRIRIAQSLAELGAHDRAVALADTLEESAKYSALLCIAIVHARRGSKEKFQETLRSLTEPRQLAQAYYEAAQFERQRSDAIEARRLLRLSFELLDQTHVGFLGMSGDWPTPELTLLLELLEAQAKAGDFEGALATALKGKNELHGKKTGKPVRSLARLEVKEGRFNQALAWIRKLKEPVSRAHAYLGAAEGLIVR